ncbi:MAG: hypothetical protein HY826_11670 [Actinobacteria bacterium]|nr:hypothetical protein [Actinomycetota bacterium]
MRLDRLFRALVIVASVSLLASCSDSDSKSAISKDEFLTKANARCAEFNEAIAAAEAAAGPAPTEEQVIEFINDVIVPGLGATMDDIRGCGFPAGDEELLDGLMDETAVALDALAEDPTSIFSGEDPFVSINQRLGDYGLTVCADS